MQWGTGGSPSDGHLMVGENDENKANQRTRMQTTLKDA